MASGTERRVSLATTKARNSIGKWEKEEGMIESGTLRIALFTLKCLFLTLTMRFYGAYRKMKMAEKKHQKLHIKYHLHGSLSLRTDFY